MTSVLDKLLAKTGKTRAEIGLPEVHEIPPAPPPVPKIALPTNASVLDKMLARAGKTYEQAVAEISPFLTDESRFTLALRTAEPETERLVQVRDVDLSDDQKRAYDQIMAWLNKGQTVPGQQESKLLTFGGFSGTGKTTLIALVAQNFKRSVAFCAYTGKATSVLRKKLKTAGVTPAFCGTIHSLCYQAVENKETGEVAFVKKGYLGYKTEDGDTVTFGLLVIDEASMVPEHLLADLQSYGVRILAVGDHGQLPPVRGSGLLMQNPNIRLEKIHRQAESNPIIRLSACIRETGKLLRSAEDGDKIRFVEKKHMQREIERLFGGGITEEQLLDRVVLVYSNASRCAYNAAARAAYLGARGKTVGKQDLHDGDLTICLYNMDGAFDKGSARIYNGLRAFVRGSVTSPSAHKYLGTFDFADYAELGLATIEVSKHQLGRPYTFSAFAELAEHGLVTKNWWEIGKKFDYGYVLTGHKVQGSEFSDVLVLHERPGNMGLDDAKRWLYTAVTRASERLTVVY